MLDDDDTSITAGSIVTVQVYLKRQMMEVLFDKEDLAHADEEHDNLAIANEETESNKDQVGGDKAGTEQHGRCGGGSGQINCTVEEMICY